MREIIRFLIGFAVGFAVVYKLLTKGRKEKDVEMELDINEPPEFNPFESSGKLFEILKRFNEMKNKV
ncbi:hypothetical protein [Persephonella sp.]